MRRILLSSTALLCWSLPTLAQSVLGGSNIPTQPQNPPAQSIGSESNWYIDWLSGNVFGPKSSGQWPQIPIATLARIPTGTSLATITSPLTYFAVCDGHQHPLSEKFKTIPQAQAAYGSLVTVTSLSQDLDTLGWQAAFNTGKLPWFPSNSQCWIRQQVIVPYTLNGTPTKGVGIIGDGSGQFIFSDIDFPSTTGADATTPLGNPIRIAGAITGNPTFDNANQIDSPVISGFTYTIQLTSTQGNIRPILLTNSKNAIWYNTQAYGFNISSNVAEIDSSQNFRYYNNNIHDSILGRTGSTGQLTALAIDDTVESGLPNSTGKISQNACTHLTVTTAFNAAFNYQTDCITVLHNANPNTVGTSLGTSTGVSIVDNDLEDVGEPIDFQASFGLISANKIRYAHLTGIKLIHGAQHNLVEDNHVYCATLSGIETVGSSFVQDTAWNLILGNHVAEMDCNKEKPTNTIAAYRNIDTTNQTFNADNNTYLFNYADGIGGAGTGIGGSVHAFEGGGSGTGNSSYGLFYTSDFVAGTPVIWIDGQTSTTFPVTNNNGVITSFTGTITFGADQPNNITLRGGTTGNPAVFSCVGTDTNVGCNFNAQAAGIWRFRNGNGDLLRIIDPGAAAVNYAQIRPGVSGSGPLLNPGGSTNIPFTVSGAGTEGFRSNFYVRTADPTTTDISTGLCADWDNTTAGTLKRVCNLAGTLHSVTYP